MIRSALFLVTITLLTTGTFYAQDIPKINADTLAGGKIVLPDAVLGHPSIFNLGFSRAGGDSTGRWGPELKKQFASNHDLRFYSVAILQDAPKMVRGMIRHGMRGSTPKNEQDSFILIYEDEDAWKKFAGFSNSDDAYVVLLDSQGKILARVHGKTPDDAGMAILREAIAKISSAKP
jgi:hypothetical protein